jgi:1-acyl-sn-glycerol-3-phosphate acyltransferase
MVNTLFKKISDFFYNLPRILFINFYKLFTRTRIFNKKRLPENSSVILAINHSSDADPIIVLSALRKKIYFFAESENFENWISNFFMRKFANCIPVFKSQFTKNVKSFKELFSISNNKNVFFGIFPEGRINKEVNLHQFQKGAAYFSYKTKFPIVPIYLHNTNKGSESKRWIYTFRITKGIISLVINTFRIINIFIGEPIDPTAENIVKDFEDLTDKKAYKSIIENINSAIKEEFLELKIEADVLFNTVKPKKINN